MQTSAPSNIDRGGAYLFRMHRDVQLISTALLLCVGAIVFMQLLGERAEVIPPDVPMGVIDRDGNWVIQPRYDQIYYVKEPGLFWTMTIYRDRADVYSFASPIASEFKFEYLSHKNWTIFDENGIRTQSKFPAIYFCEAFLQSTEALGPNVCKKHVLISSAKGSGLCDGYGNVRLKPVFKELIELENGNVWATLYPPPAKWYYELPFYERFFYVSHEDDELPSTYRLFDKDLRKVVDIKAPAPAGYISKLDHSTNIALFRQENGQSFQDLIDGNGQYVFRDMCSASPYFDGIAAVIKIGDKAVRYVDANGKSVTEAKYNYSSPFQDGLAIVSMDSKTFGIIDRTGQEVLPLTYARLDRVGAKRFRARKKDKDPICLLNDKFERIKVFSSDVDEVFEAGDGMLNVVFKNKSCTLADINGNLASITLPQATRFREGLAIAAVKCGATLKYGAIDKTGKWIVTPRYKQLFYCSPNRFIAAP